MMRSRKAVTVVLKCRICGSDLPLQAMFCGECGSSSRHPGWVDPPDFEAAEPVVAEVDAVHPGRHIEPPPAPVSAPAHRAEVGESPEPEPEPFEVQFSTGETVVLAQTGLIGRNPVPQPGEYFDALVRILDPAKSVSKTHLEFGLDDGYLWVADRFSGNGTIVRRGDGSTERCEPGKRRRVARGDRVEIGDQFFMVN